MGVPHLYEPLFPSVCMYVNPILDHFRATYQAGFLHAPQFGVWDGGKGKKIVQARYVHIAQMANSLFLLNGAS